MTTPVDALLRLLSTHGPVFYTGRATHGGRPATVLSVEHGGRQVDAVLAAGQWHVAGRTYPVGAEAQVAERLRATS